MRKLSLPLFLFCTSQLLAQTEFKPSHRYLEAGFLFGLTNYSGDVSEKSITLSETHLGFGANVRYFLSQYFSLRAQLFSGSVSGDDANAKDPQARRRSIRFGTNILEVGLGGEWHILGRNRFANATGMRRYFPSPYFYLGIGGAFTGAKAEYYGAPEDRNEVLLAPIPEVGLRQHFLIAPMGVGLRLDLNEKMVIGGELGWRPLFADDLDGVRMNGNPDSDDWYYYGGITLSFVLNTPKKRNQN